jgi:hypothetical protein
LLANHRQDILIDAILKIHLYRSHFITAPFCIVIKAMNTTIIATKARKYQFQCLFVSESMLATALSVIEICNSFLLHFKQFLEYSLDFFSSATRLAVDFNKKVSSVSRFDSDGKLMVEQRRYHPIQILDALRIPPFIYGNNPNLSVRKFILPYMYSHSQSPF